MKKLSKILLLLSTLILTLLLATACGGDGAKTLEIKSDRTPQLVHVLGEELDLSDGVLLLTEGDSTREIAMNDEGVEISGYDKTVLGEQEITLTYGGASVKLTVTTVERMKADGVTTEYLVGDELDTDNGTLKITRNDGTSFTVILKSDKVTVEGFDTSAPGDIKLKAKYTTSSGTYECEFTAKVYDVEDVKFNEPNRISYNSHDGELDVAGGYFTLSGKGGALKRDVPLTADMVSGFDITLVNETNSPLTQKLTVKYGEGHEFEYSVKLSYSIISLFKKNAQPLLSLDWSGSSEEEPEITKEQGTVALEMIEEYFDMSPADRRFITAAETLAVARAAMSYGFNVWSDEILKYSEAFAIEYGELVFKCESREAVEAAIIGLADETTPLYTYSPILLEMMEGFAEESVNADYLFADYPVLPAETYAGLVEVFNYTLELDDIADKVPENWKEVGVNTYADKIEAVYQSLITSGFATDPMFRNLFYYVSYWRTNDDMFDFLYAYYYGNENLEALNKLSSVRFPGELEELYAYLVVAMNQINESAAYGVADTSEFIYNYYMAVELAEKLSASEDEMTRYLYENLSVNGMLGIDSDSEFGFDIVLTYLRTVENGFYYRSGALLGVEAYHDLMDKYMSIVIRLFDDDTYEETPDYGNDIEALFSLYTALPSSAQFSFLGTLNGFYGMGIPPLAFDNSEEFASFTCVFVDLINEHFTAKFEGEAGKAAYSNLVVAMELYAQRYTNETWLADFKAKLTSVGEAYANGMSAADRVVFETYLLTVYNQYDRILKTYVESDAAPDLGDYADDFQRLEDAVVDVELFYTFISEGYPLYNLFFSAFEKAERVMDDFLAKAPENIKEIYNNAPLYSTNELLSRLDPDADLSGTEEILWSYDYVMSVYRGIYINYLLNFNGTCIYDVYVDSGVADMVVSYNDLVWVYLNTEEGETAKYDKAKILSMMKVFSSLDAEGQMLFIVLDEVPGNTDSIYYYYMALEDFLFVEYGKEGKLIDTVTKMIELEQLCVFYESFGDAEILEELKAAFGELVDLYGDLSGDDLKHFNDDLGDIYKLDTERAERLIKEAAEAEAATPAA